MNAELIGTLAPDPALKGVERFLAPEGRKKFLAELGASLPLGKAIRLTVVKQRPGQRAVVKIERLAPEAPCCWYAKFVRADRPAAREALARIAGEASALGIHAPAPVLWIHRFRALVLEGAEGAPLLPRREPASFPGQAELFVRVGSALARLHRALSLPEKDGGREVEIDRVRGVRVRLQAHRPELRGIFDEKLDAWSTMGFAAPVSPGLTNAAGRAGGNGGAAAAPGPTAREPAALHGDFHPGQVLAAGSLMDVRRAISVLDWDEACAGEAERDAGNFLAHLTLEASRRRLSATRAETLGRAFRLGYEDLERLAPARLDWYLRGSLLRLAALHADPSFGSDPPNPPELAEALLAAA